MLRPALPLLLLILASCGSSQPAAAGAAGSGGQDGTGGTGGDPCAGVQVQLGGIGDAYVPLHDGDPVNWQWGLQGCCHIWTGFLASGFRDDDNVLYEFKVVLPDGTDWSVHEKFCSRVGDLDSAMGGRDQTCQRDRMDYLSWGLPPDGPVKLQVTIRDGVTYDPEDPDPCKAADVPHCEASAEVTVAAQAPPPQKEPGFCLASP